MKRIGGDQDRILAENGDDWVRASSSEHVTLYTRQVDFPSPKLLLAFTGHGKRLMLPISRFLSPLPIQIKWVLLLTDPSRNWFVEGVPEVSNSLADSGSSLLKRLPEEGRRKVSTFGSSSGALAALVTGHSIGAGPIGLVAPQHGPHLRKNLGLLAPIKGRNLKSSPLRVFSGLKPRDLRAVFEMAFFRRGIGLRLYPTPAHNVMFPVLNDGILPKVQSWINGSNFNSHLGKR